MATKRSVFQKLLHEIDLAGRFWFGHPRRVAAEVLEDSDWQPDSLDAFCWRCGGSVGPGEWNRRGCAGCRDRPKRRIGDGIVRLGPYTGELREWILATKYQQWHEMGSALGRKLGSQIRRSGMVDAKRAIVVPMPMPWQRRMYRGIDHAHVIASAVAKELRAPRVCLLRRTNGPTQASLEPGQRRTNAKRGIGVKWRLGGWPLKELEVEVVLVDDVSTTGSSLQAAVRLLRDLKPFKIVAAVLAVSDESARRTRQQTGTVHEAPGVAQAGGITTSEGAPGSGPATDRSSEAKKDQVIAE